MNEVDRKTLDEIRHQVKITTNCELATSRQLRALINIIDELDEQLTDTQAPAMRKLLERAYDQLSGSNPYHTSIRANIKTLL